MSRWASSPAAVPIVPYPPATTSRSGSNNRAFLQVEARSPVTPTGANACKEVDETEGGCHVSQLNRVRADVRAIDSACRVDGMYETSRWRLGRDGDRVRR